MPTFTGTVEDFKRAVAEFCQAIPTLDRASLENGLKAVHLTYLGFKEDPTKGSSEIMIALSYLEYAQRRYTERDIALLTEELAAE